MKLLALDANSIVNRAFYGIRPLSTKDGVFTNGIYGFVNILLKLIDERSPDVIAAAFDLKAPTFRHKMYADYKAGRKPMPEELRMQIPILKELLRAFGCVVIEKEGYEADDILGTLAKSCTALGDSCFIATGDRDSLQLVSDQVSVLLAATKAGRPEVTEYTPEKLMEDYHVTPPEMIELKALQGDSSDNIPGVAGIGPKTAGTLIEQYHNIEYIYENLDTLEIKDSLRTRLAGGKESALLSKKLGTICCDAPIEIPNSSSSISALRDSGELARLLARLEMYKIIDRLKLNAPAELPDSDSPILPAVTAKIVESDNIPDGAAVLFDEKSGLVFAKSQDGFFTAPPQALYNAKAIVTHNTKLLCHGIAATKRLDISFDCMLAAYLLDPDKSEYSLQSLCTRAGIAVCEYDGEQCELLKNLDIIEQLFKQQSLEIDKNGQHALLCDIEIPLAYTLYTMEREGFLADAKGIAEFGDTLAQRIETLQQSIYKIIGYEFNLNSPKQLGEALFEKLGLPHGKKTKTGYSTSAEVLEGLRYESDAVELLLEYRTVAKLKSTYCDGLLKVIGDDGRVRSTLNQTETRTGRISSSEPNLQNIPVRTELGAQLRRFFVAREGYTLVDADYSQIELRVLAEIADDARMKQAFEQKTDIHTVTASQVFNLPVEMVTPQLRSNAKAVNFGIVYGIGAFSLSKDIGVSVAQAKRYIEGYLATYSGVDDYMKRTVEKAREDGFVSTVYGRRRYLPELTASNFNLRAFGERVARNMPIQGTAADIIKIAMNRVQQRLEREQLDARLIMQVHDELICEAADNQAQTVAQIVKEEMENAADFSVQLTAEVNIGKSWYDAK